MWTANDRTVFARMEQYLNENDNMRVEIEEWSFVWYRRLGSGFEANLEVCEEEKWWQDLRNFSSKGQSEFLVASRVRRDERQRVLATQEEESIRKAQEIDYEVDENRTAVCQLMARRVSKYLEDSDASRKAPEN